MAAYEKRVVYASIYTDKLSKTFKKTRALNYILQNRKESRKKSVVYIITCITFGCRYSGWFMSATVCPLQAKGTPAAVGTWWMGDSQRDPENGEETGGRAVWRSVDGWVRDHCHWQHLISQDSRGKVKKVKLFWFLLQVTIRTPRRLLLRP